MNSGNDAISFVVWTLADSYQTDEVKWTEGRVALKGEYLGNAYQYHVNTAATKINRPGHNIRMY